MSMTTCNSEGVWEEDTVSFENLMDYLTEEIQWLAFMDIDFVTASCEQILGAELTEEQYALIFGILDADGDGKMVDEEVVAGQPDQWTLEPTRVDCGAPTDSTVEGVAAVDGSGTLFEDTRNVVCQAGYSCTDCIIMCEADGTWTSLTGQCVEEEMGGSSDSAAIVYSGASSSTTSSAVILLNVGLVLQFSHVSHIFSPNVSLCKPKPLSVRVCAKVKL